MFLSGSCKLACQGRRCTLLNPIQLSQPRLMQSCLETRRLNPLASIWAKRHSSEQALQQLPKWNLLNGPVCFPINDTSKAFTSQREAKMNTCLVYLLSTGCAFNSQSFHLQAPQNCSYCLVRKAAPLGEYVSYQLNFRWGVPLFEWVDLSLKNQHRGRQLRR